MNNRSVHVLVWDGTETILPPLRRALPHHSQASKRGWCVASDGAAADLQLHFRVSHSDIDPVRKALM